MRARAVPITAEEPASVDAGSVRPYTPSWVDRLSDWVQKLPVPGWLFYATLGLALYLLGAVVKWNDGTLPPGTIFPLHLVFAGVTAYMLAMIPFLNDVAGKALQKTRAALSVNDAEYASLHFELTVMPARPLLVANVIGALFLSVSWLFLFDPTFLQVANAGRTPASLVIDIAGTYANIIALSALIYHTIHQLRQVRRIYAYYVEVDLFQTGPLYAFSTLTARTAIALIIANYTMLGTFVVVSPVLASNPLPVALTIMNSLAAVLIFAWPLLDLHNSMKAEKQQMLDKNASEMKSSFNEKRRRIERGEFHDVAPLKDVIDTLIAERGVLEKLPTWPWQATTVRGLGTALLLPILLWLTQRILERLLSF